MTDPGAPQYVGLGRRALAFLLDNLVWLLGVVILLGFVPVDDAGEISEGAAAAILFVVATLWFNYFAFAEWRWGQTIGKNATGIEVTSEDGGRISFGQASIRNLLRLVDVLVIGPVMIAGSERRQRLGDRAAKTVVLRRRPLSPPAAVAAASAPASLAQPAGQPAGSTAPPAPEPAAAATAGQPSFAWVTWSPTDVFIGVVAAAVISTLAALVLVAPWDSDISTTEGQLVAQLALWGTLIGVALGAATSGKFRDIQGAWRKLGFRGLTWRQARLAGLAWLGYLAAAAIAAGLLDALFGYRPDQEELSETLDVDLTPVVVVALYASTCVIAPLTEETFFRGFLFGGLRRRWPFWAAAGVSGLIFGVVHAGTGVAAIPFLAALGIVFAYLYERTGSIWPSIIAHTLNNLLAITVQVTT
ncbi:MAG TPA: CPBP family glutamic-type intramembrane protease [Solirubrobacterales bacterium]|jgi:hypothetical protein|nr:CPBP family glutamic-type intramembrane protease [Solirubrobacterales bacterium]